jgi:hypothetical protein
MIPVITGDQTAEGNRQAWELALDRLERDTVKVEHLLRTLEPTDVEEWAVPDVGGPIPADLLPRALEVQRRQAEVMGQLKVGIDATLRHQAYAARVTSTTGRGPGAPAYVDLTA